MKLHFNNKEVLELSETQKKVIKNDIPGEIFEADMARRCKYCLESPIEKASHLEREKVESVFKKRGKGSIPIKPAKFMALIAEEFEPPMGLADIDKPLPCQVGLESFSLSEDHRKGWRKILEEHQKGKAKEEYLAEEEIGLGELMASIIQHKYERCFKRLKLEWNPKFEARGLAEIPSDPDEYAELVFSQPDYKDRSARDLEELEVE